MGVLLPTIKLTVSRTGQAIGPVQQNHPKSQINLKFDRQSPDSGI
ncbi:hypothetical protein [Microcoleus sp.]